MEGVTVNKELLNAIAFLSKEKGVSTDVICDSLEAVLITAYKKEPEANPLADVELNRETGDYRIVAAKTVVEDFSGSYEFALFGKDHEVFMPYLTALSPIYIEGSVEEKYFVKPEDRKTRGNPPYAFKIKKITLLGNIAEEHIKGFSINISTSMLNNGFREKLITVVKHNKGNIPLSMTLFDPQTNYKIEFLSKKFRISVTMPFINELKDLNVNYSVIKK